MRRNNMMTMLSLAAAAGMLGGKRAGQMIEVDRRPRGHPATTAKPQSESLKRLLGKDKRGQYKKAKFK
jgi:hypothetical protein